MSGATIDILLAVYNGEQFLRQTLDSIVSQSFRDFELIKRDRLTTVAELNAQDAKDILRATYRPTSGTDTPVCAGTDKSVGATFPPQRVTLSLDLLLFRISGSAG